MVDSLVTTTEKLLSYDDNSYFAIDYTQALQTLNDTLTRIEVNQRYEIVFLVCLIAVLLVLIFTVAYKQKNF